MAWAILENTYRSSIAPTRWNGKDHSFINAENIFQKDIQLVVEMFSELAGILYLIKLKNSTPHPVHQAACR